MNQASEQKGNLSENCLVVTQVSLSTSGSNIQATFFFNAVACNLQ